MTLRDVPSFLAATPCRRFGAGEEAAVVAALAERNSRRLLLQDNCDLAFDEDGALAGGLRFTRRAFQRLSRRLGRGLYYCLTDLTESAGLSRTALAERMRAASSFLNRAIGFRFRERLEGCSLLVSSEPRLVEGVLSPRSLFRPNSECFRICRDFLAERGGAIFHGALLEGPRMYCRFREAESLPIRIPGDEESYYRGWQIANSEAGDLLFRAYAGVVRGQMPALALEAPCYLFGEAHSGRGDSRERLLGVMTRAWSRASSSESLCEGLRQLTQRSLGRGNREHAAWLRGLSKQLVRAGVPGPVVSAVLSRAFRDGKGRGDPARSGDAPSFSQTALAASSSCTPLDLCVAAIDVAGNRGPDAAEKLGRFAFRLLSGQLKLTVPQ